MYKSHGIGWIRLVNKIPQHWKALRLFGIQVLVGVKNEENDEQCNSYIVADYWAQRFIGPYQPDINFRYIVTGNQVIP